jgi:hypothetical protein
MIEIVINVNNIRKKTVAVCDIFKKYLCLISALEPEPSEPEPHGVIAPARVPAK